MRLASASLAAFTDLNRGQVLVAKPLTSTGRRSMTCARPHHTLTVVPLLSIFQILALMPLLLCGFLPK